MARPKKKESDKLIPITGFVSKDWDKMIGEIARMRKVSKSQVVSESLGDYLAKKNYIYREA